MDKRLIYYGTRRASDAQIEALRAFSNKHGPTWKRTLIAYWVSGQDEREPEGLYLRQLRNRYGTAWLQNFRFPRSTTKNRKQRRSVRAVSGGLPTLGKRR